MSISERELLRLYGGAVTAGNATLFVGAGLSLDAGLPTWEALLADMRQRADIPPLLRDLPLVAQYIVQNVAGGREALESDILHKLSSAGPRESVGHGWLAELPVDEIWTTNYDNLMERALPSATVIASDDDLKERQRPSRRRILKMHGSLSLAQPPSWRQPPVITRRDYEEYEASHPRLWAALKAAYLTRSMLFLGFSFADPNIELLLRLSRLLNAGASEHFTVLRRPSEPEQERMHELQVKDLERSGVAVYEIADFAELEPFLRRLLRRTRSQTLFVGGSDRDGSDISSVTRSLGHQLSAVNLSLASLAGPSAMRLSYAFGRALLAEQRYRADRVNFYFRRSSKPPPALEERIGTAIYSALDQDALYTSVVSSCRAALFIGGGDRTEAEIATTRALGVPMVPLAMSGGAAQKAWSIMRLEDSGIAVEEHGSEHRDWELLANSDKDVAVSAALRLVQRAMFIESPAQPA